MITEKMRISKDFPIKVRLYFRKENWYLFPQGFTSKGTMSKLTYNAEKSGVQKNDVHNSQGFWIIYDYHFTWLFLSVIFETRLDQSSNGSTPYVHYQFREPDTSKEIKFEKLSNN